MLRNRCLEIWLSEENSYPLCRNILFDNDDSDDNDDSSEDSDDEVDPEDEKALVRAIAAFED